MFYWSFGGDKSVLKLSIFNKKGCECNTSTEYFLSMFFTSWALSNLSQKTYFEASRCFKCHVSLLYSRFLQYFQISCKCYESIDKTEGPCHYAKLWTKKNRMYYMHGKLSYYSPILTHTHTHTTIFSVTQCSAYILSNVARKWNITWHLK